MGRGIAFDVGVPPASYRSRIALDEGVPAACSSHLRIALDEGLPAASASRLRIAFDESVRAASCSRLHVAFDEGVLATSSSRSPLFASRVRRGVVPCQAVLPPVRVSRLMGVRPPLPLLHVW